MRTRRTWYQTAVLMLVVVSAIGWLRQSSAQQRSVPSYDYKLISTASADLEKLVNTDGAAGWRVAGINERWLVLEHVR